MTIHLYYVTVYSGGHSNRTEFWNGIIAATSPSAAERQLRSSEPHLCRFPRRLEIKTARPLTPIV